MLRTASDGTTQRRYRLNIAKEAEQEATEQMETKQDPDTLAGLVSNVFGRQEPITIDGRILLTSK